MCHAVLLVNGLRLQMPSNPIAADNSAQRDGVHHGFLRLPYSRADSAGGSVMIPITVIKNGIGRVRF